MTDAPNAIGVSEDEVETVKRAIWIHVPGRKEATVDAIARAAIAAMPTPKPIVSDELRSWLLPELKNGLAKLEAEILTAEAEGDRFWGRYWSGYFKGYETLLEKVRTILGDEEGGVR